ncbi:MAG: long-chain fatty acid--CoA ligase [Pseudomonadota bacterium]|nr:long-chain fatty acid--CoA ligase [Pseudomonadota bacterium]
MNTLASVLVDKFSRSADAVSMHYEERGADGAAVWKSQTWREAEARVASTAAALWGLGIRRGDRVAILGGTHPRWLEADFATLCVGGVTVGIYPTLRPEAVHYQLVHSGAKVLLVESQADIDRLADVLKDLPELAVRLWELPAQPVDLEVFRARARDVRPEEPCAIFYTSGTTGEPKGAVITHRAMVSVCRASLVPMPMLPGESSIVFLPLAHSLQRMAAYRSLLEEISAYFCPSIERITEVLPLARPAVIATVPRMLEKIKARIEARVAKSSPVRQRIFAAAIAVGLERSLALEEQRPVPRLTAWKWALADRIVFTKVRANLGGNLRLFAVGGARLDPSVGRFFHAMGIGVFEAWGLSETCAPATLNCPKDFRFGTVGKPLAGVELKLEPDGEVLVRGPGLFSGYWNDPVATANAFTEDGYFRTGDIGELVDGYLKIIDRKKELLVTSGGKNIPPVNIEKRLEGGIVGQAVVIGSERPYLVALFAPDPDHAEGLDRAALQAAGEARVKEANASLAPFEQIKRFAWLPAPLSVDNGMLTPTMKLKRRIINEAYRDVIDGLYR